MSPHKEKTAQGLSCPIPMHRAFILMLGLAGNGARGADPHSVHGDPEMFQDSGCCGGDHVRLRLAQFDVSRLDSIEYKVRGMFTPEELAEVDLTGTTLRTFHGSYAPSACRRPTGSTRGHPELMNWLRVLTGATTEIVNNFTTPELDLNRSHLWLGLKNTIPSRNRAPT